MEWIRPRMNRVLCARLISELNRKWNQHTTIPFAGEKSVLVPLCDVHHPPVRICVRVDGLHLQSAQVHLLHSAVVVVGKEQCGGIVRTHEHAQHQQSGVPVFTRQECPFLHFPSAYKFQCTCRHMSITLSIRTKAETFRSFANFWSGTKELKNLQLSRKKKKELISLDRIIRYL